MNSRDVRSVLESNRPVAGVVGLSLLSIVISLVVGMKASSQRMQDGLAAKRLENSYEQLQQVQRGFQPGTPTELNRWRVAADSQWLAIPHGLRLSLAQRVTLAAESAGLRSVRVRFGPADSLGSAPQRPSLGGRAVSLANYTLVIECEGGFAHLLTFVNYMPAVVSIQRVTALRGASAARYRITLAVYEVANANQPG